MDEIHKEIEVLKETNTLILVEGKKDKKALENLGLNNIKTLNKPIHAIVDECADCDKVVILTDLDAEGKRIYSQLSFYLSRMGVKIDNRFRNFLFRETKLRQIEGLTKYLEMSDFHYLLR